MKNILLAVSAALVAACGNSGNPALSKTFNYGAATAPTTSETAAATTANSNVATAASFGTAPAAETGAQMAGFALGLASAALGDAPVLVGAPSGSIQRSLTRAATFDTCAKVAANSVTFTNCTDSEEGFNVTLNGSLNATATTVGWGITATFSGTVNGVTINVTMNHTGNFTYSPTNLSGNAATEFSGNVSAQGQSASFGFAVAVLPDVTFQASPACVTNGSLEVRRVWTNRPSGASGAAFTDAGVKMVWTGCNTLTVSHSI